jgi:putative photosynthetic complex assembly protein
MTVHQEEVRSEKVPRGFLIAAGALIGATLVLVAVSRLTGSLDSQVGVKTAVAEYHLLFEDRADGAVAVLSADDRRLVALMEPGTNGFVRGTLRALVRERRLKQAASQTPFRLVLGTDGSLILHDPTTDRRVDLRAFGPANVQAFASLLPDGSKTQ